MAKRKSAPTLETRWGLRMPDPPPELNARSPLFSVFTAPQLEKFVGQFTRI